MASLASRVEAVSAAHLDIDVNQCFYLSEGGGVPLQTLHILTSMYMHNVLLHGLTI